jgi:hypothetical protein
MRRLGLGSLPFVLASCFSEQAGNDGDDDSDSASSVDTSGASSTGVTTGVEPATSNADATSTTTAETVTTDAEDSGTTGEPTSFCDQLGGSVGEFAVQTCLDFDAGDELDGWTILEVAGGGVTFGAPARGAPPRPPAMRAAVPVASADEGQAALEITLGQLVVPLHLEFAMNLECVADTRLVEIVFPGATPFVVFLQMTPRGLRLGTRDADGHGMLHELQADALLDAGPWARWRIVTDPLSGYADIFVDDMAAAQITELEVSTDLGEAPVVRVGALDGDSAGCAVWFDEIVVY